MKKKILIIIALVFFVVFSLQILTAQGNFMNKSYINNLIEGAKDMQDSVQGVTIEIDEMFQSSANKTINGLPVAYELYISITSDIEGYFPETGKYLSGLYIDDTGIYDIANGAYYDETNYMPEQPQERFIIEGTKNGGFVLILMMSEQTPYFGDFISPVIEPMNDNNTLGRRYAENALMEMEDKNADVFVFELDSTTFPQPEE
jgi:hypothetical protein